MVGLGWLGLVEFGEVDRPMSCVTDGHSANLEVSVPLAAHSPCANNGHGATIEW